ncbi:MAG TPA: potassium channel family protein [Gaiellaceae bacterium]|nr:potassium channel family protein [Gaiellaceae bacterium]
MSTRLEARVEIWSERLTLIRAVATIIGVAILLVAIAGVLARVVEGETFTSLGLAYWWAMETVTTVGYGDIVPHTLPGRLVGTLLMLTGIALIPTLTSVIVSTLVSKRRQEEQERLEDMLTRVEQRLQDLEQKQ